jgi:Rieske Fe-S protein
VTQPVTPPMTQPVTQPDLTRRTVLGVLGGGAAVVLAGCGNGSEAAAGGADAGSASPGTPLVATADVPVGSGVILADEKVVVTQPTKGTFLGFSAICTHLGCPVDTVSGDRILCPCHGSVFSVTDGSVLDGPAPKPLPSVEVAVKGGQVVQG